MLIIFITSGILYPWTGSGKMVHTSTYQYTVVQHGTGQYENSSFVQGSMYQYIPVQAFNKTCGFPMKQYKAVQGKTRPCTFMCFLAPPYSGVQDFWVLHCPALYSVVSTNGFQRSSVSDQNSTCWYIPEYTGIHQYIHIHTKQ